MSGHVLTHASEDQRIVSLLERLPTFEEALARLLYVVEQGRPCGLVVGPEGTGKSYLLRSLYRELTSVAISGARRRPVLMNLGRGAGGAELSWRLAAELGLSPSELRSRESDWRFIEDRLLGASQAGQASVAIIDHLPQHHREVLEALSRLLHMVRNSEATVVLSACSPLTSGLIQTIGGLCDLRIELSPLAPEETAAFVAKWLESVGFARPSSDVSAALHTCCGGRIRDLLRVLRLATFAARSQEVRAIELELLQTIMAETWQPPGAPQPSWNSPPRPRAAELTTSLS